jgi:hypothetical protein
MEAPNNSGNAFNLNTAGAMGSSPAGSLAHVAQAVRNSQALENTPQSNKLPFVAFMSFMAPKPADLIVFNSWAVERRRNNGTGQMQDTLVHYLNFNMDFVFDQSTRAERRNRRIWVRIASDSGHDASRAPERGRVSEGKNVVMDNSFSILNKVLNPDNNFNALIGEFTIVNDLVPKSVAFIAAHKAIGFNTASIDDISQMDEYKEKMVSGDHMVMSDIFLLKRDSGVCANMLNSQSGDWAEQAAKPNEHLSYMPSINSFHGQMQVNCKENDAGRRTTAQYGLHETRRNTASARWQLTGSAFISDGTNRPEHCAEIVMEYNDIGLSRFVTEEKPGRCQNLLSRLGDDANGFIHADGDLRIGDMGDDASWGVSIRASVTNNRIMPVVSGTSIGLSAEDQDDMAGAFRSVATKAIGTSDQSMDRSEEERANDATMGGLDDALAAELATTSDSMVDDEITDDEITDDLEPEQSDSGKKSA